MGIFNKSRPENWRDVAHHLSQRRKDNKPVPSRIENRIRKLAEQLGYQEKAGGK